MSGTEVTFKAKGITLSDEGAAKAREYLEAQDSDVAVAGLRVDEEQQALVLEGDVVLALLVEGQLVLEPGAAATLDANPQPRHGDAGVLGFEVLAGLGGTFVAEGYPLG
ncbi:MAG: hypothetical protein ACKOTA_05935, partial [Solirubrobacterales bacterium]